MEIKSTNEEKEPRTAVDFIFKNRRDAAKPPMQLKMFTIPVKNISEAEAELNGFLRGHRVLAVKKGRNIEHRTSNFQR